MAGLICIHFKSIFIFSLFLLFYPCPTCCFRILYQIFMCVYFLALTHFIILFHKAPHFIKTSTFPKPQAHAYLLSSQSPYEAARFKYYSWESLFLSHPIISSEKIFAFFLRQTNPFWAGTVARKITHLEYEFSSLFRNYAIPP